VAALLGSLADVNPLLKSHAAEAGDGSEQHCRAGTRLYIDW
jgi:hypothetical protein